MTVAMTTGIALGRLDADTLGDLDGQRDRGVRSRLHVGDTAHPGAAGPGRASDNGLETP